MNETYTTTIELNGRKANPSADSEAVREMNQALDRLSPLRFRELKTEERVLRQMLRDGAKQNGREAERFLHDRLRAVSRMLACCEATRPPRKNMLYNIRSRLARLLKKA